MLIYNPIRINESALIVDFSHPKPKKNKHKKMRINKYLTSVVVPVYNEIEGIEEFHIALLKALDTTNTPYEVVYIDDHSTDGTYEWLKGKVTTANMSGRFSRHAFNDEEKIGLLASVKVYRKEGKKGKAFSLYEGFKKATGSNLVMIDGDLQYAPSNIPLMLKELKNADVVIANRKNYKDSLVRKITSQTFRFLFGKLLFGLSTDIQSGLKVFTRRVLETVEFQPRSGWTFDLEFLHRAELAGFSIKNVDITFLPRTNGRTKVKVIRTILEIGLNALFVKLKKVSPLSISPEFGRMRGAGIGYKKRKYITHTTLPISLTALQTFSFTQKLFIAMCIALIVGGLVASPITALQVFVSILSILYFVDTLFNLFLVLRSLGDPQEIKVSQEEVNELSDPELPVYSILCPLYREAHVVPQFLDAIKQLDYPKEKLDVMLLLEEDDKETIYAIERMRLPFYVRTVIVPDSQPKTKPKACNYGLSFAKGEYLVIYDAEDIPDPLQLKKAYLGFHKAPERVQCLQAKLNFYNSHQNLLTRFFTAEYSLWFDLTLTGLQTFRSTIPLGGTSNHFRTKSLIDLQGWDPFNVTEDADLGIRLFKKGFETAIIDSTTLEEATSNLKNWLRQRSRWLKGYMQTYLVHMRSTSSFVKEKGIFHQIIFQLTVGGKLLFVLLNPVMWLLTILYFTMYQFAGPLIQEIYIPPVSYIAVFSWVFGNFLFLYCYMIALGKRKQWDIMKYSLAIPLYWLMMSAAGFYGLYQLIFKPHYWEKTLHGFHLAPQKSEEVKVAATKKPAYRPSLPPLVQPAYASVATTKVRSQARQTSVSQRLLASPLFTFSSLSVFMLLDIILAFYFLPLEEAKVYVILSLFGKGLFIFSQSAGKIFSRLLARSKRADAKFVYQLFFTFLFSWIGFVTFGLEGDVTIPVLFGSAMISVLPLVGYYLFTFMCFSISQVFVSQNLKKNYYTFAIVSFSVVLLQIPLIFEHHESVYSFVVVLSYLSIVVLIGMIFLQVNSQLIHIIENNVRSLLGLFDKTSPSTSLDERQTRILIFNWRDTKHVYGGGAEVYIHELAKRWVQEGIHVTLFCGNDNKNLSAEIVDGVEVIRRGGTYTVYIMAFVYYLLKLKGKYDIIIDCENGIPFFTPLFIRTPVVLLIFHVHQEVFRVFLPVILRQFAAFLEGTLMPLIYKNNSIVTISNSSRDDILKLGFTDIQNINIVHSGVSDYMFAKYPKTEYPSFAYVGRLRKYKNVDVAIKAFSKVVKEFTSAKFFIAGSGECKPELKELVNKLHLTDNVIFYGRVSEEDKKRIFSESWVAIQPSQIEGWGITVIEANAAGTPVIASRVNGLKDSVLHGETGLLVEAGNIEGFATAMKQLLYDNVYRRELSRSSIIWAQNFKWSKSARDFYMVIDKNLQPAFPQPAYSELLLSARDEPAI